MSVVACLFHLLLSRAGIVAFLNLSLIECFLYLFFTTAGFFFLILVSFRLFQREALWLCIYFILIVYYFTRRNLEILSCILMFRCSHCVLIIRVNIYCWVDISLLLRNLLRWLLIDKSCSFLYVAPIALHLNLITSSQWLCGFIYCLILLIWWILTRKDTTTLHLQ